MTAEPAPSSRSRTVTLLAVALTVGPLLVDPRVGQDRLFAYSAADASYYLQVARNAALHGSVSFDGSHATNGFHPLWQLVLTALTRITTTLGIGDLGILWVSTALQLAALGGTTWLVARTIRRAHDGRLTTWFLLWPFGFYAVLLAPAWVWGGAFARRGTNPLEGPMPLYGTIWSYLNGMETPLVLLAFALVLWRATAHAFHGRRSALVFGLALVLVTLARLDTIFVTGSIIVTLLVLARRRRDVALARFGRAAAVVLSGALAAYLVANKLYAGAALPVSGSLKSTFPRPTLGNWRDLRSLLTGNTAFATLRLYRHGPIVISTVVAVVFLATTGRATWARCRAAAHDDVGADGDVGDAENAEDAADGSDPLGTPRGRYRLMLTATAAGVIALAAYDEFFVPGNHQGHWYWPLSTAFVSLAAFEWLSRSPQRARHRAPTRLRWQVLGAGALVVAVLAAFVAFSAPDLYHQRFAAFAQKGAPVVRRHYASEGLHPKVIELDDGIDAYYLGYPALSGTGLALDRAAVQAYKHGTFLDLALDRGYDRLVSLAYLDATDLTPASPSDQIRDRLAAMLPGQDLRPYRFSVEYRLPQALPTPWPNSDGSYVVIRIHRR